MGQATEQGTKAWAADQQADDHDTEDEPFEDEFSVENIRDFIVARLAPYIPREYRYAEGIHEVRAKIFGQYGAKLYSKAMGIFYDLLESDDTASGHGDDGDVWRSWRHDFKNRKASKQAPRASRRTAFSVLSSLELPLCPICISLKRMNGNEEEPTMYGFHYWADENDRTTWLTLTRRVSPTSSCRQSNPLLASICRRSRFLLLCVMNSWRMLGTKRK
jgi:hypothetical protein